MGFGERKQSKQTQQALKGGNGRNRRNHRNGRAVRSPCKGGRTRTRQDAAEHAGNTSNETHKERNKAAEEDGGGSLNHERATVAAHTTARA
eukprot:5773896-Prymnesium_polylepis.1